MNYKQIILSTALLAAPALMVCGQSRALPVLEISTDARNAGMGGNQYGYSESMLTYSNLTAILYGEETWNASAASQIFPKEDEVGRLKFYGASVSHRFSMHGLNVGYRYLGGYTVPLDEKNTVKPADFTIDLAYSIRLSDHFSAAVGASFIHSKVYKEASTVAFNAAAYYRNAINSLAGGADYVVGVNVANLGPSLDYGANYQKAKLPLSFGGGGEFGVNVSDFSRVSLALAAQYYCYPQKSKLFTGNVGAECAFGNTLFLRAGYNYAQHDLSRATVGIGAKYSILRVDFAYLKGMGDNEVDITAFTVGVSF